MLRLASPGSLDGEREVDKWKKGGDEGQEWEKNCY